jgi:hypothetical protein
LEYKSTYYAILLRIPQNLSAISFSRPEVQEQFTAVSVETFDQYGTTQKNWMDYWKILDVHKELWCLSKKQFLPELDLRSNENKWKCTRITYMVSDQYLSHQCTRSYWTDISHSRRLILDVKEDVSCMSNVFASSSIKVFWYCSNWNVSIYGWVETDIWRQRL